MIWWFFTCSRWHLSFSLSILVIPHLKLPLGFISHAHREVLGRFQALAVMERSGDLSLLQVYFLSSGFWGTVSCDVKAGPQPPLHHCRHLNPFPLLAFYTTFTAAQVFNTDQSLLLSSSFITPSFLLFFFPPHPFLFYLYFSSSRPVYLSLPHFFLSPL